MSENKWVVLKQEDCLYCKKALDLLQAEGETVVEVIDIQTAPVLKDFMRACGLTTVPQVYYNGYLIGGFDGLEEWYYHKAHYEDAGVWSEDAPF